MPGYSKQIWLVTWVLQQGCYSGGATGFFYQILYSLLSVDSCYLRIQGYIQFGLLQYTIQSYAMDIVVTGKVKTCLKGYLISLPK